MPNREQALVTLANLQETLDTLVDDIRTFKGVAADTEPDTNNFWLISGALENLRDASQLLARSSDKLRDVAD